MGKNLPLKNRTACSKTVTKKPGKSKATESSQATAQASEGLHGPEKPGWNAGGKEKLPGNIKTSSKVKQQQQPTSQKSPGGSPKQVSPLGILLSLQKFPRNIKRSLHKEKNN